MRRRSFIQKSTLGVIGIASLDIHSMSIVERQHVNISLTPWSLIRSSYGGNDPLDISVLEFPKVANTLGFRYIDHEMFHFPPNLGLQYINRMNRQMESAGVQSAVMLTGGKGDVGDKNLANRKKALATYRFWIDVAVDLNCKAMRNVCAEFVTIPNKEKLKYAIEGVHELGEYAASKGLDLLIENHNGYSSNPEWMVSLMQGVNLKNVGVLGDFTNWTLKRNPDVYYPDPYQGFELLSPYICAISAKSSTFDANGNETTTDYQRMFSILKNAPDFMFAGVEFFGNELSRNLGAKKTRELIEKVLAL